MLPTSAFEQTRVPNVVVLGLPRGEQVPDFVRDQVLRSPGTPMNRYDSPVKKVKRESKAGSEVG